MSDLPPSSKFIVSIANSGQRKILHRKNPIIMKSNLIIIFFAIAKIIISVIWTIMIALLVIIIRITRNESANIRQFYLKILCQILGIRIIVHGKIANERPLLMASNHVSYIDILAFGATAPIEFVSKAEVANWPIIGLLAKISDTVFIERRRSKTLNARKNMTKQLNLNRILLFFPEATANNGNYILPFKSSLFETVKTLGRNESITLQPAVIAFTQLNGLPTGFGWRSFFAWYGRMPLAIHLWRFLQIASTTVEIAFLNPILPEKDLDRKILSPRVEKEVSNVHSLLISGRPVDQECNNNRISNIKNNLV